MGCVDGGHPLRSRTDYSQKTASVLVVPDSVGTKTPRGGMTSEENEVGSGLVRHVHRNTPVVLLVAAGCWMLMDALYSVRSNEDWHRRNVVGVLLVLLHLGGYATMQCTSPQVLAGVSIKVPATGQDSLR